MGVDTSGEGEAIDVSSLTMPGWRDPEQLSPKPEAAARGRIVRHELDSAVLGRPHAFDVYLTHGYEESDDLIRIEGTLVVEKQSHKAMVIGAKGDTIKKISTEARQQIEGLLQRKVYLRLWVKVVPSWTRDPIKARALAVPEDP